MENTFANQISVFGEQYFFEKRDEFPLIKNSSGYTFISYLHVISEKKNSFLIGHTLEVRGLNSPYVFSQRLQQEGPRLAMSERCPRVTYGEIRSFAAVLRELADRTNG